MIKSLRLGEIKLVPALVEIVDDDKVLLERIQSEPYRFNEEIAFDTEGRLLSIIKKEDSIRSADLRDEGKCPMLEFAIMMDHRSRVIRRLKGTHSDNTVKHRIEQAYETAADFFNEVKSLKFSSEKTERLRRRAYGLLDKIKGFDFKQYLLYKIE